MADSQSKRLAGEVEVFVEHLAGRRETDIYLQTRSLIECCQVVLYYLKVEGLCQNWCS